MDMEHEEHESERSNIMGILAGIAAGAAVGAGLMYLTDPARGRRRRALLRDQSKHAMRELRHGANVTIRDLNNRATGLKATAGSMFNSQPASPETLEARVRSALGHAITHPRAIRVSASGQEITLSGDVLADELNATLTCVASVKGVALVNNQLNVHEHPGRIPALANGGSPTPRSTHTGMSPSSRLLLGAAGSALASYGITRRDAVGSMLATAGLGAMLRAGVNMDFSQLTGLGEDAGGISVQKTIHVNAPIDRVFRFWQNVENFPRFMSHVHEVRDLGGGISHWKVTGPAGYSAEWDAVITDAVPNELLSWRSVGEPGVENSGSVRFSREGNDRTRVDIRMEYQPPAGAIGHVINSLFGTDPQHSMEEDLARLKSLLEHGKTSIGGHDVWLEDLARGEEA